MPYISSMPSCDVCNGRSTLPSGCVNGTIAHAQGPSGTSVSRMVGMCPVSSLARWSDTSPNAWSCAAALRRSSSGSTSMSGFVSMIDSSRLPDRRNGDMAVHPMPIRRLTGRNGACILVLNPIQSSRFGRPRRRSHRTAGNPGGTPEGAGAVHARAGDAARRRRRPRGAPRDPQPARPVVGRRGSWLGRAPGRGAPGTAPTRRRPRARGLGRRGDDRGRGARGAARDAAVPRGRAAPRRARGVGGCTGWDADRGRRTARRAGCVLFEPDVSGLASPPFDGAVAWDCAGLEFAARSRRGVGHGHAPRGHVARSRWRRSTSRDSVADVGIGPAEQHRGDRCRRTSIVGSRCALIVLTADIVGAMRGGLRRGRRVLEGSRPVRRARRVVPGGAAPVCRRAR